MALNLPRRVLREKLIHSSGFIGKPSRIVIAGGGPTAFELAASVMGLGERLGADFRVTVVRGGTRILSQLPGGAVESLISSLERRGLQLMTRRRVIRVVDHGALNDRAEHLDCDYFINATGLKPPSLARDAGLPTDSEGAMIVDDRLRSTVDPTIFGGGDFVQPEGETLDKVGVHAIRQAPVLLPNVLAALRGQSSKRKFAAQRRYLWIMNLGDGTGLAVRGRLYYRGRPAFLLKDSIDRRFLRASSGE